MSDRLRRCSLGQMSTGYNLCTSSRVIYIQNSWYLLTLRWECPRCDRWGLHSAAYTRRGTSHASQEEFNSRNKHCFGTVSQYSSSMYYAQTFQTSPVPSPSSKNAAPKSASQPARHLRQARGPQARKWRRRPPEGLQAARRRSNQGHAAPTVLVLSFPSCESCSSRTLMT